MPAQTVSFAYDPTVLAKIRRVNANLRSRFSNLVWLWNTKISGVGVREILEENERAIFEQGQAEWPPIAVKYRAYKIKLGYDPRILVRTGRMMRAATEAGSADNIAYGDARNYYYGVNAEAFRGHGGWSYPEIHQRGTGIARRSFVFLRDQAIGKLKALFGQAILDEHQAQARNSRLKSMRVRKRHRGL